MIKSMTAFASADLTEHGVTATVEIRGYNSRYLDLLVRMPPAYGSLEDLVKQTVTARIQRGRLEIRIGIKTEAGTVESFRVNEELADAYYEALTKLKQRYNLAGSISLRHLSGFGGVIEAAETEINVEAVWQTLQNVLSRALSDLEMMREKEGRAIAEDISKRILFIEECVARVESQTEGLLEIYQQRLSDRIATLTRGLVEIDSGRIAQEAAFLADKGDISEELVRARSHLAQFRELMDAPEPAGKSLNFLLQEFSREFNTMGVKAGNADISHMIVSAKTELEKIREQIQNVE